MTTDQKQQLLERLKKSAQEQKTEAKKESTKKSSESGELEKAKMICKLCNSPKPKMQRWFGEHLVNAHGITLESYINTYYEPREEYKDSLNKKDLIPPLVKDRIVEDSLQDEVQDEEQAQEQEQDEVQEPIESTKEVKKTPKKSTKKSATKSKKQTIELESDDITDLFK